MTSLTFAFATLLRGFGLLFREFMRLPPAFSHARLDRPLTELHPEFYMPRQQNISKLVTGARVVKHPGRNW